MKGEIIYFDNERGNGFISGADGNRYVFDVTDLANDLRAAKGAKVDFETEGDRARQIAGMVGGRQNTPSVTGHLPANGDAAAHVTPFTEPPVTPGLFRYFRYCATKGYLRFRGRARRREYWSFILIYLIGLAIVGGVGFAVGTALGYNEADEPQFAAAFLGIYSLALLLPSLSVLVRRVHDIGLSGWFILLALVPMIGSLIILVFTLVGSQKHENKWGPVPTGVHV
jgi:uncharacterized membrane protein YhaH (DUF805 family)/cold shock CspA family protein